MVFDPPPPQPRILMLVFRLSRIFSSSSSSAVCALKLDMLVSFAGPALDIASLMNDFMEGPRTGAAGAQALSCHSSENDDVM
ncbi:MAG: hypothetical protein A4E30_01568 [Methanomassiliicoccales archaeon PtaB.Bin215]|nr:MAG: hypothetical protein A4E30_01568 [Methanomassiliicoccales archaeon PtaB.Bin215]